MISSIYKKIIEIILVLTVGKCHIFTDIIFGFHYDRAGKNSSHPETTQ